MNGDLSRTTFDPQKSYSSVRAQQGRATLDADVNEQIDIQLHDARGGRRALIGASGGHINEAGFDVQVVANQPQIQSGRYWVEGIEVTLGTAINVANQPALPGVALPNTPGLYVAYLDVWERPISAIQDPEIREVALGGPDTSTRTQVVWQVRLLPVTSVDATPDCLTQFPEWTRLVAGPQGTLEVRVAASGPVTDPCLIPESAGFRGLENQLYRIQIHAGNFAPTAANGIQIGAVPSFKWSRDNGSMIATWREHPAPLEITVDRLGPGGAAGFGADNWIELTHDHDDLLERGGVIGRIASVAADTLLLDDPGNTLTPLLSPTPKSSATLHSQVRRWDSAGVRNTAAVLGQTDVTADGWIRIEDGIEVRFSGGPFRSGSHWTIPARTATLPGTLDSQIDWPLGAGDAPLALPAHGPVHRYARLALLQLNGPNWTRIADCRQLFPQLTELTQIQTRGGDGQHGRAGHFLPAPLRVAVVRGGFPVVGARVLFSIVASQNGAVQRGFINASQPNENGAVGNSSKSVIVTTDAQGQATVWWQLGSGPAVEELGDVFQRDDAQEVLATMLAADDNPTGQLARFTARVLDNYMLVAAGGEGQIGQPGETLEIALRARVSDGARPVAGAHVEFRLLDLAFEGAPLNQFSGGSLHASVLPVSTTLWPTGTLAQSAVVATNADGVAQIQWTLGTLTSLGVRSVEARLINEANAPTTQSTLFTAHLAIASEIGWTIPTSLQAHLPNPSNHLQAALEGVATALARLGLPLWAIQPRAVHFDNSRLAINPALTMFLVNLAAIELQALFPVGFNASAAQLAAAVSIWYEHQSGAVNLRYRITGTTTQQGTTARWAPTANGRTFMANDLAQAPVPHLIVVELMPSALGMFGHPQQWSFLLSNPIPG
jgi:hypothetical protein